MQIDLPAPPRGQRHKSTSLLKLEFQWGLGKDLNTTGCRPSWTDAAFLDPDLVAIEIAVPLSILEPDKGVRTYAVPPFLFHSLRNGSYGKKAISEMTPGQIDTAQCLINQSELPLSVIRQKAHLAHVWRPSGLARILWLRSLSIGILKAGFEVEAAKAAKGKITPSFASFFTPVHVPLPASAHERLALPGRISRDLSQLFGLLDHEIGTIGGLSTRLRLDTSRIEVERLA